MSDNKDKEKIDRGKSLNADAPENQVKKYTWFIVIGWTVLFLAFLVWDIDHIRENTRRLAIKEARANFNKDQAFRYWSASHGGAYVAVDEKTPPNPYLKHIPERDIRTPSGKQLTLMNPAYMVRQMNEFFKKEYGISGHITSLKLHNPANVPDEWERKALEAFERGEKEVLQFSAIKGEPYIRLMQPMVVKEDCLKCHDYQGYKVGDIRGGVSVSIPLSDMLAYERRAIAGQSLSHGLIWFLGLIGIAFASVRLKRYLIELMEAKKALAESNALFQAVIDQSPIPMAIAKATGELTYNPACAEHLHFADEPGIKQGIKLFEMNQPWKDYDTEGNLIPKEELPLALALKGKFTRGLELRVVRRDGSEKWEIVNAAPIYNDKGELIAGFAAFPDITGRKRIEEQLKSEKDFTDRAINAQMDTFFVFDVSSGKALRWNSAFRDSSGYSDEEIAAMKAPHEWYDAQDLERASEATERIMKEGKGKAEMSLITKDGKRIPTEYNASIIRDEEGRPKQIISIGRDITERKRAEKKLQEAEERANALLNATLESLILMDLEGNILAINTTGAARLGKTRDYLVGKNIFSFMPPELVASRRKLMSDVIRARKSIALEDSRENRDFYTNLVPVKNGTVSAIAVFSQDISERKQVEVELKKAKENAEATSRAKTDFLSRMSHELRTPLNSILGFGQVMQTDREMMADRHKLCVDEIVSAGWHLTDLVNDVLDISRVESGEVSVNMEAIPICPIMEACVNLISPLAQERNIHLSCNLTVCNKAVVWGDKTRLKEVLLNILSNAVKYNVESGTVTISCEKIDKKRVRISISDSGKGISEEDRLRIFIPFASLKREDPALRGAGIGLAISKHLVELMEGSIGVQSVPGKGSTFRVELKQSSNGKAQEKPGHRSRAVK
ncbi:MAG: PAS domain S-box protein [Deltaproteobacteria bacterium]|nr:PAS domain S-box protein [Deltaproteobacteria bacterium]